MRLQRAFGGGLAGHSGRNLAVCGPILVAESGFTGQKYCADLCAEICAEICADFFRRCAEICDRNFRVKNTLFLWSKTNFGHLGGRMRSENRTVFGTTLRSIPRRFGRTFRRKRQQFRRKFRRTPLKIRRTPLQFRRTPLKFRRTPWGSQAPPLHEPVFSPKALKKHSKYIHKLQINHPSGRQLIKN